MEQQQSLSTVIPPLSGTTDLDIDTGGIGCDLGQLPVSASLLRYYKERLEKCEQESYADVLTSLESLKTSTREQYETELTLRKFSCEIHNLNQEICRLKRLLFDEQKKLIDIQLNNGQQHQFKKMETTTPNDQEQQRQRQPNGSNLPPSSSPESNLARALQRKADQQAKLYVQTINILKSELQLANAKHECNDDNNNNKTNDHVARRLQLALDKNKKLQEFAIDTTTELLNMKHMYNQSERKNVEDGARFMEVFNDLKQQLAQQKIHSKQTTKVIRTKLVKERQSELEVLRARVIYYEQELKQQSEKLMHLEPQFNQRYLNLKTKFDQLQTRHEKLQQRRAFELEGYGNDIRLMKQSIKMLEKQLMKRDEPADESEIALFQAACDTGDKASQLSRDLHILQQKLHDAQRDVEAFT